MFEQGRARVAAVVVLLWVGGCGPLAPHSRELGTVSEALSLAPDEMDLAPLFERVRLYSETVARSREEASAELFDGPALFAVERDGHLVAAALPEAAELLTGTGCAVDVDASPDPWPSEPRAGLGGLSERTLAQDAGSRLARVVGATPPFPIEREVGAPYAAAFVQGTLRLNPVLLYLASGASRTAGSAPAAVGERGLASAPPDPSASELERLGPSCAVASGGLAPWLAPALLALLSRKRRGGLRRGPGGGLD